MTALVSPSSQYSDGSEFAMSDSSMLDFVRDLNGQSDNRFTVNHLPFDIDTPVIKIKERSSSPEIDLVPQYLYTPSSQLIPTATSSLFNYRTGGNFRKKLSSLGSTLFSKTPPSGIPQELLPASEKSAPISPRQSVKEDAHSVRAKRGFKFPGRSDAAARKTKKEARDEKASKPEPSWLNLESSTESPGPATGPNLEHSLPLSISDPFLSDDPNDLGLEPAPDNRQESKTKKLSNDTRVISQNAHPPVAVAKQSDISHVAKNSPKSPDILNPSKAVSKAKLKTKKAPQAEKADERKFAAESAVIKALTGIKLPEQAEKEEIKASVANPSHKQSVFREEDILDKEREKHPGSNENPSISVDSSKPPRPARTEKGTAVDVNFEKMKKAIKNANPPKSTSKSQDEKRRADGKVETAQKTESTKKVEITQTGDGNQKGDGNEKGDGTKAHPKKSKKKHASGHTLITIDNSPTPLQLPRGRPPLAMINMPKTALPKNDSEDDDSRLTSGPHNEHNRPRHPIYDAPLKDENADTFQRRTGPGYPPAFESEKLSDQEAELQYSPFVVSGLSTKTKPPEPTTIKSRVETPGPSRNAASKESTSSARAKNSSSTLLPSWTKFQESIRSGKRKSSPMHRLTTLFTGTDSQSQSQSQNQSQTNTVSDGAAFLPREPDRTWQEKPTVQSLGDMFSKPTKTGAFESTSGGGTETHKWRNRLRFGFSSPKEEKVVKTKPPIIEREWKPAVKESKPKSILKPVGKQGSNQTTQRAEGGPGHPAGRGSKKQVSGNRKKGGTKKA